MIGAWILLLYFRSIRHVPPELATLTSLAVSTAVASFVLLVLSSFCFASPALWATLYAEEERTGVDVFTPRELLSTQAAGIGGLAAWIMYSVADECAAPLHWSFYAFASVAVAGLAHVLWCYWFGGRQRLRLYRIWTSVVIAVLASAPIFILITWGRMFQDAAVEETTMLLSFLLGAVAANTKLVEVKATFAQIAFFSLFASIVMFVLIPLGFGRAGAVSAAVAETIGIRSEGPVTALLTPTGCLLVQAAARREEASPAAPDCSGEGVNAVRVWVLSNVGQRWVLGLHWEGSPTKTPTTQLTVPASEINVVHAAPTTQSNSTSCRSRSAA